VTDELHPFGGPVTDSFYERMSYKMQMKEHERETMQMFVEAEMEKGDRP
jgi:hypothetical protein